jgi:hypothetical protein
MSIHKCPDCGNGDELRVRVTAMLHLYSDGSIGDPQDEDVDWKRAVHQDPESFCDCSNCSWEGTKKETQV